MQVLNLSKIWMQELCFMIASVQLLCQGATFRTLAKYKRAAIR